MEIIRMFLTAQEAPYIAARVAVILCATFLLTRTVRALMKRRADAKIHRRFLYNLLILLIWAAGIMLAVNQMPNFDRGLSALLAGSGIAALTIGLAAQESLGNAINGMFLSMFRPFEVGDRIRLVGSDITGYVEDITLRHTVVRTFMNSRMIVPNSVINKELIENSTFWDVKAAGFIDVVVDYDSDIDLACKLMAKAIGEHPSYVDTRPADRRQDPKVTVYARALGLFGVELRASMWTQSINNNFDACSDARKQILREFRQAGIKIAVVRAVQHPGAVQ